MGVTAPTSQNHCRDEYRALPLKMRAGPIAPQMMDAVKKTRLPGQVYWLAWSKEQMSGMCANAQFMTAIWMIADQIDAITCEENMTRGGTFI